MLRLKLFIISFALIAIFVLLTVSSVLAAPVQPTPFGKPATVAAPAATLVPATPVQGATAVPATPNQRPTETSNEVVPTGEVEILVIDEGPYKGIEYSFSEDGAPVLGSPDAPITIIEFADYACPHCQRYMPVIQQFITDYVATGRARYEYRNFPTAGGDATYVVGSVVACFEEQRSGSFWLAHDRLFEMAQNGEYNPEGLQQLAESLDINFDDAYTCAASAERTQVDIDVTFGRDLDVGGTPAVRVRYGDAPAQHLVVGGDAYDNGGAALEVLIQAVEDAETGDIPAVSES
ncbi:MAG: thioredoxin domain-containing protein [Anaerolineae bacterium]